MACISFDLDRTGESVPRCRSGPNGARTFLSANRSGDFPVPGKAVWKPRPPVIDLSAEARAKAEAEARETDEALKARPQKLEERRRKILEKLGV